ncbi:FRG domain-containing protein [Paraflavisolibacter sp. H34]|uniref:FRG domain-containing protein n=1 Tax=Huijunlia imazamoxiresistens TaxID=3127457 RepID=UPI0030166E46
MKTYTTIRLTSWNEYKSFVDELSENWAYRGQGNAHWVLNNAIERTDFIKLYKGIETEFLHEFQRGARNYLNKEDLPGHIIEWLALMQHHGAPTRLLDFTKSPFIASFFAFEQCNPRPDHDIAVWAINVNYLKLRATEELSSIFPEELKFTKNLINERLFEKIFNDNNQPLVFPVQPFRMNRRYSLQQSIFVSTGISSEPFMDQLLFIGDQAEQAIIKIEMPSLLQKSVLRDLQRMNLNRASLFPDLDGYAAALKLRYNSIKTPEEVLKQTIRSLEDKHHRFLP